MRILIIPSLAVSLPPVRYGGVERVAYDLAVALSQRGHKIGLVVPEGSTLPRSIEPLVCGRSGLADAELRALPAYENSLPDFEVVCDLSHLKLAHTRLPESSGSVYVPVCGTTHLPEFRTQTPRLVCVSEAHAKFIRSKYGVGAKVVYNGVDVELYGPPLPTNEREERLIFIGRFAPEKGALEALEIGERLGIAMDMVEGQLSEPTILSLYRHLARMGFPGLGLASRFYRGDVNLDYLRETYGVMKKSRARYFANAEHDVKRELLRRAKAFVFPLQWEEPFGLTVVEAAASGLAVVAYSRGSMPELIQEGITGFLVPPGDRQLFVQRIGEAKSIDPLRCLAHAREKFSRETMASGYEQIFKEAVGGVKW